MDSEEEARRYKRSGTTIESKAAKKPKIKESFQAKEDDDKLIEEQFVGMIYIEPEVLDVEPLQTKHPITGWEIYSDDFGDAWKIIELEVSQASTQILKTLSDLVTGKILTHYGI